MQLDIDKIFCCHHPSPKLAERKYKLIDFFSSNNLNVEWVESGAPEETKQYNNDSLVHKIMTRGPVECRNNIDKSKDLSYRSMSLILKHNYCYEQQIENNYENILILEDDVDLFGVFSETYFNKCMKEFKQLNLGMLFLGSCCGLHYPNTEPDKYVYFSEDLRSRCTHCYILNIDTAKKLLKYVYNMFDSVDWQLNSIIEWENIKTGWGEPSIAQLNYESSLQ